MGKEKSKKGKKGSTDPSLPRGVSKMAQANQASLSQLSEEIPRLEERHRYETPLTFRSYGGVIFHGVTTDVSLSGAFLHIGAKPLGVKVGDEGVVVIHIKNEDNEFEMTFTCAVARVTETGLGLNFDLAEEND